MLSSPSSCAVVSFNSRTPGGVRRNTLFCFTWTWCFNSRTPGGVRPIILTVSPMMLLFQFTHPGRGATTSRRGSHTSPPFQFTHPGRGATDKRRQTYDNRRCFNSRTPGGVRPEYKTANDELHGVSIHAPREGCDYQRASRRRRRVPRFNSRTPGGVRLSLSSLCLIVLAFQFTHPGRGATDRLR